MSAFKPVWKSSSLPCAAHYFYFFPNYTPTLSQYSKNISHNLKSLNIQSKKQRTSAESFQKSAQPSFHASKSLMHPTTKFQGKESSKIRFQKIRLHKKTKNPFLLLKFQEFIQWKSFFFKYHKLIKWSVVARNNKNKYFEKTST